MSEGSDRYILAVDLGTSGPKSAIVSMDGEVIDSEFRDVPLYLFPGGGAEQDPHEWWDASHHSCGSCSAPPPGKRYSGTSRNSESITSPSMETIADFGPDVPRSTARMYRSLPSDITFPSDPSA